MNLGIGIILGALTVAAVATRLSTRLTVLQKSWVALTVLVNLGDAASRRWRVRGDGNRGKWLLGVSDDAYSCLCRSHVPAARPRAPRICNDATCFHAPLQMTDERCVDIQCHCLY